MMHLKGKIRKHRIRLAGLISPFFFLMGGIWATVCWRGTKTLMGTVEIHGRLCQPSHSASGMVDELHREM